MPDQPVSLLPKINPFMGKIAVGLALWAIVASIFAAYQTLTKRTVIVERDAARATIRSMDAQSKAADVRYRAREANLEAQAAAIRRESDNEIDRINADRDAALDELRARPGRGTPATTTTIAGACSIAAGGTGAFLFREDAQFLTGEAARADSIRVSLKACYAQYDDARDSLAEER